MCGVRPEYQPQSTVLKCAQPPAAVENYTLAM
jgi:hypothetical protein